MASDCLQRRGAHVVFYKQIATGFIARVPITVRSSPTTILTIYRSNTNIYFGSRASIFCSIKECTSFYSDLFDTLIISRDLSVSHHSTTMPIESQKHTFLVGNWLENSYQNVYFIGQHSHLYFRE